MHYEERHPVAGGTFGTEGVDELVERAEAVCLWERRRIELTNESPLVAKKAAYTALLEDEKELTARLARVVPVSGANVRRRRIVINWIVATVLIVSGLVLAILTLEPFRLGLKGVFYAIGIALVVPFLVERTLDHFPSQTFRRVFLAFACLAGLTSMILLATVRGNLLGQQVKQDQASSAIIEGENSAETPKQNTFYEDTVPLLQLVMALLALAMEVGAGIAILEAERMSESLDGEHESLKERQNGIRQQLAVLAEEIALLQNEGPIFVAEFWRDFYWALLKGTLKNAAKRFVLPGLILIIMLCPQARSAPAGLDLIIAVDLSKSVDQKGPDGETSFEKNLAAVTELLGRLPAGTNVTIIGITAKSYSQPYIILKTSLGTDPGYFGERLTKGRQEIVRAWKARTAHLEAKATQTDILGMLLLAGELFRERQGNAHRRVLVVYSDMRQATGDLNLEHYKSFQPSAMIARVKQCQLVADLDGVQVYVLGASSASDRIADSRHLREFWQEYFHVVGATVKVYSILRDAPAETVVR